MPSLPFTFEDLKNLNPADMQRAADESDVDPTAANNMGAQKFLTGKINQLKDNISSADGLIDVGLAMNPVTRYTDMASKFFGGPGVAEGFKQGVTHTGERGSKVILPPMPF